ncbi:bifunctional ornithine acetyltransferase/N-acetylglutamate synthase [Mesobacillus subterraneus]|uniref:Arginine biosynthesis bifunctional protein ArgJ n=1 Tax=Mesobacillus subterraneus TaxID=285983 RepID=A0A3R9FJC4_9BACI|nr:bifunctional ornithine acetyltransferase/N-acetylglutamate synthase [Mesobacillus subterraneus]RSD29375.1 bifunctional ornithine acetyltransferase/N-acetylglutamate synthase [Mesobacillus subterraneus]
MYQIITGQKSIKEITDGSILTPEGFQCGGVHAGLRYNKLDLGMVVSEIPASCAAVYTTSSFQAAPLIVTQDSIASEGILKAVIVNSACANACTGEQGYKDALNMRKMAAEKLGIDAHHVAVASTGVIGEYMQMGKIAAGIENLAIGQTAEDAQNFQTAILTTDTVTKHCCYSAEIDGKTIHMGGAAKGSGMIHPNMATMLGFLTTDANIPSEHLSAALKEVTNTTFNQITVDGDTSTNDMVLVMANGAAGNRPLNPNHPEWPVFIKLLQESCGSLAKQIARDGEGATKLMEISVKGAGSDEEARQIGKQIAGSNLVKTAVFGADANWGRIIGAIGQSKAEVNPKTVDISLGNIALLNASTPVAFDEDLAREYLMNDKIQIFVDLHLGSGSGMAWGCDLSYDYVKINASYRT